MIKLHVDTKVSGMPWGEFLDTKNGIALDGYVFGKPWFNPMAPSANFNHHEEVDRLTTRATCSQVLMAVRQGLLERFRKNGEIEATIYVNDCDQDVCLSWFILNNSWVASNVVNPALNRLVHIEDMMDTCGGSYPFDKDMPILKKIAWVFQPYTAFRLNGGLDKKNNDDYASVIKDVESRIMRHITGDGESINLETNYEVLQSNSRWSLIRETGKDARGVLSGDGIKAFVSVRNRSDGKWTYTVGKSSAFIDFDMQGVIYALNNAEGNSVDMWGGSDIVGGSPRSSGSKLSPDTVAKVINDYFKGE